MIVSYTDIAQIEVDKNIKPQEKIFIILILTQNKKDISKY